MLGQFFWGFRYSPGFYLSRHSPGLFSGTYLDPFLVLTQILPFSGTRLDSTPFPVLAQTLLRYSPEPLSRYLPKPFSGTHPNPFLDTRPNPFLVLTRTLSWYSPGPFSGTRPDSFPVLTKNSTLFWYSPEFDPFLVLTRTLLQYSPAFYLFRYSPIPFFDTHPDSTILQYSPKFHPFFSTRPDMISSPASCPNFLGLSSTRPNLIPFPLVYSGLVSRCPDLFEHCIQFLLVFSGILSRFLQLSPTLCLDPLVHSVNMTHFPQPSLLLCGDKIVGHLSYSLEFISLIHYLHFALAFHSFIYSTEEGHICNPQFCPSTLAFYLRGVTCTQFFLYGTAMAILWA